MSTKTTKKKEIKWRTVQIKVPVCPKCGANMEKETNADALTMYKYVCNKCYYRW